MLSIFLSAFVLVVEASTPEQLKADLDRWRPLRRGGTAPQISQAEITRAFAGEIVAGIEVVENIKAGKGYAIGVFDVPIGRLWRGVCDEDHHAGALKVDRSEIVEGAARADGRTLFQYLDVPIVSDRWWLVQLSFNERLYGVSQSRAWELSWVDRQGDGALKNRLGPRYTGKGVGVAWTKGAWLLIDLGNGRTFIEYHTWSDPGGRYPSALRRGSPPARFATISRPWSRSVRGTHRPVQSPSTSPTDPRWIKRLARWLGRRYALRERSSRMIGILVATYGGIGRSLLETAVDLVGQPAQSATTVTLSDDMDQATAWEQLVAAADAADQGEGVLILVDMFGSTSSTLALSLLADRNVEVLTGVNLAMVLRALLNRKDTTLKTLSEDVLNYGRRNVTSSATWLSVGGDEQGNEP